LLGRKKGSRPKGGKGVTPGRRKSFGANTQGMFFGGRKFPDRVEKRKKNDPKSNGAKENCLKKREKGKFGESKMKENRVRLQRTRLAKKHRVRQNPFSKSYEKKK